MPTSTTLEEIQSRVIGVVPAEGRSGPGFIVYRGNKDGEYDHFVPPDLVILAYESAREALKQALDPHGVRRRNLVWESSFSIDPNNPFEKLPDLLLELEKAVAALKASQEKSPRAVIYCDGRMALPDILAFLHGLKSEKGAGAKPGKACKACGQARKESDWVCPHCGDAQWVTIVGAGVGGLALMAYIGFVVAEAYLTGKLPTWREAGLLIGISGVMLIFPIFVLKWSLREFKSALAWRAHGDALKQPPGR